MINHIPHLHWGVINTLPEKSIVCFDGLHGKEHDTYEEVKQFLKIIAREVSIVEYKDCEWQRKNIDTYLLPRQYYGWNWGTCVAF